MDGYLTQTQTLRWGALISSSSYYPYDGYRVTEIYKYNIALNGETINSTDLGWTSKNNEEYYALVLNYYFPNYYNKLTDNKQEGTLVYTLSFPLLFGDDREVVIELYWKVYEIESTGYSPGGYQLRIEKVLIDGETPDFIPEYESGTLDYYNAMIIRLNSGTEPE